MIRSVVRLRLLAWLRRPATYFIAAVLPMMQAAVLLMFLGFAGELPGPISHGTRQSIFALVVGSATVAVAMFVPALASGALLRTGEDDEVARLAAAGSDCDTIFAGALLAELTRGLLLVWAAVPVMLFAALILRPRHAILLLLLPHLAAALAVICGLLPSILAPTRFAGAALGYIGVMSSALAVMLISIKIGERRWVTVCLALAALTMCGIWLGLRTLRWRGLHFR